jgi:hypothetical protein
MQHEPAVLSRFNLTRQEANLAPFSAMLRVRADEMETLDGLKSKFAALEKNLLQLGKRVILVGTPKPPKASKVDPLRGLNEPIVSVTLKQFKITDADLERDVRIGWIARSIITGREFIGDLKRQIPSIERILAKLASASEAHQEQK